MRRRTSAYARRVAPRLFRVGWWVLVVLTALLVANHALGLLTFATSDDERALFVIFLAFGMLSLVVLWIPYRRLERWSWWATWIPVVANVVPLVLFPFDEVVAFYAGVAVVMAAAQLMALPHVGRLQGSERAFRAESPGRPDVRPANGSASSRRIGRTQGLQRGRP